MNMTIDHIDPINSGLVCGMDVENNKVLASVEYNARKVNRFVPYRVCEYPPPNKFGDLCEFCIGGDWKVCEFGGRDWWEESNRVGNCQIDNGFKTLNEGTGIFSQTREDLVLRGKELAKNGVGVTSQTKEDLSKIGKRSAENKTGAMSLSVKSQNGTKTLESGLGIFNQEYRDSYRYLEDIKRGREKGSIASVHKVSRAVEVILPSGEVFWFPSITAASKGLSMGYATVHRALKNTTYRGHLFSFLTPNPFYPNQQ